MTDKKQIAFLVGMPRAATTFLYHNLNLHPDVFIPYRRKTNYFSLHHNKGESWFMSHFKDVPKKNIAIDTETLAFINRKLQSPQLIKRFNADAKIILCIRDPADWAVSLYHQIATFDGKIRSFEDFLAGNYSLTEDGIQTSFCMNDGDISARIEEYKELFSATILILRFREVTKSPLKSLRKIEEFLGISRFYDTGNIITKVLNSSSRRHSKLLNMLLRNENVIASVRLIFPRKAVLAIRWMFDGLLAGEPKDSNVRVIEETEAKMLALARNHYRSDIEALERHLNRGT